MLGKQADGVWGRVRAGVRQLPFGSLGRLWRYLGQLVVLVSLGGMLSGCIQYDVGIQFDSQTHGQWQQTIHLDERVVTLDPVATQQWLTELENAARSLGGKIIQSDVQTLTLTIPFYNGAHLVKTFNQFFAQTQLSPFLPTVTATTTATTTAGTSATTSAAAAPKQSLGLDSLSSGAPSAPKTTLTLDQHNWLLAIQNHLIYDLDLQDVAQPTFGDRGVFSQIEALTLGFSLTTPWGIQMVAQPPDFPAGADLPTPALPTLQGHTAHWGLTPGMLNHIDVTFWVPSPIGLGALAIVGIVAIGYGVKYGRQQGTMVD